MDNSDLMERLYYTVNRYFNECVENGEKIHENDWISAYDCFCGCYGTEFDFNDEEIENVTKQIWSDLMTYL